MRYGVLKEGFKKKGYPDILQDMQNLAKELFGEDIDVSERNPLGMTLQNIGWEISTLWELAEDIYNSSFVDTSEGQALDSTGKYIAMVRKEAQPSLGFIEISGNPGVRIPKGFRVGNESLTAVFQTIESATIDINGVAEVGIEAIVPGVQYNVPANILTKIVNPTVGVRSCNNPIPTRGGLDTETDREFRLRYYRSVSLGGSSTREAVEAALLNLPDIVDAFVEENTTMEFVEDIPPKSLAPYVFGGTDQDIVNIILSTKAGGIRSFGTTIISATDALGVEHQIGFTRPEEKQVYITMDVVRGEAYPGDNVVRRAILNYVGGQDEDGIIYKGLRLGDNVIISRLISAATCLGGINDVTVNIGLSEEDLSPENLVIGKKEIAKTSFEKVVINHV